MKKAKPITDANALCQRCDLDCKQPEHVKLIQCPHFVLAPHQLEIPLFKKTRPKKEVG